MNLRASVALLLCVALCVQSLSDITVEEAMKYLKSYGYMKQDDTITSLSKAIKGFQLFTGLEATGVLDPQTKAAMVKPRCGIIDKKNGEYLNANEFKLLGSKWDNEEVTFSITKYHNSLDNNAVTEDMRAALNVWTKYTNLRFREVNGDADIRISFESGDHGDGAPFLTGDNVLAHAFAPGRGRGGDAHFRYEVEWSSGNNFDGTNLYNVAAHEFGHALGIDHSDVPNSLMFPTYHSTNFRDNLHSDDIMAIQNLYGDKGGVTPDSQLCQIDKVDTVFTTGAGSKLVFKGNQYWRLPRKAYPNYPKKISDHLTELPQGIDAAFSTLEKDTYYFKNDRVWKYRGRNLHQGFPKSISEEFPGIPNNIDTVFMWEKSRKLFFFRGNQVWGFEMNKSPQVQSKYPVNIDSWGIPTPFDGALIFRGGIYIFKDTNYYKLDLKTNTVESGYPQSSLERWFHC